MHSESSVPTGKELQDITQRVRKLVEDEKSAAGLECSTSDEFLLRFIRVCRYNDQAAFQLIQRYFKAKIDNPEAYIVQSPAKYASMLQRKDLGLPLKDCDKSGRRVLNIKFGEIDPNKEDWASLVQATMIILEAFSLEEYIQEHGVALILDCNNFSLKIMKWATPHKLKTFLGFFQGCVPLRFEAIHFINYPTVFNVFVAFVNPFLSEEVKKKLIWHRDLSSLENHIDKQYLPTYLGGKLEAKEVENWYKPVLEKEHIFSEFRRMGYVK